MGLYDPQGRTVTAARQGVRRRKLRAHRLRCASAMCAVLALSVVEAGCSSGAGTSHNESTSGTNPHSSLARCLARADARFAQDEADLAFFFRDLSQDRAQKPGFAFDKEARVMVDEWLSTQVDNRPPRWIVWAAQPFRSGHERS